MSQHHFKSYSVRTFVPDGNPNSFKIIQKMNWTGVALEISRNSWEVHKDRSEFNQTGVYILIGQHEESCLPVLHIGQGDGLREIIDTHNESKMFWDRVLVFVSSNGDLNRRHLIWLQWMLIERANKTDACKLTYDTTPNDLVLTEYEQADANEFLNEILSLFPLVNVKAFDRPETTEVQPQKAPKKPEKIVKETEENTEVIENTEVVQDNEDVQGSQVVRSTEDHHDTIIIPADEGPFKKVFLKENCWYPVQIDEGRVDKIKYLGAYQKAPISAITYCAEIKSIEAYKGNGKYKLNFKYPAQRINPIELGDAKVSSLQEPGYTDLKTLLEADTVKDLF